MKKNVFKNSENDLRISENMLEFLVRKIRKQKVHLERSESVREICIKKKHISTAEAAFQINIVIKFLRCSLPNPTCQSVCRRHVNTYNLPIVNVSHALWFDYSDSTISFSLPRNFSCIKFLNTVFFISHIEYFYTVSVT